MAYNAQGPQANISVLAAIKTFGKIYDLIIRLFLFLLSITWMSWL